MLHITDVRDLFSNVNNFLISFRRLLGQATQGSRAGAFSTPSMRRRLGPLNSLRDRYGIALHERPARRPRPRGPSRVPVHPPLRRRAQFKSIDFRPSLVLLSPSTQRLGSANHNARHHGFPLHPLLQVALPPSSLLLLPPPSFPRRPPSFPLWHRQRKRARWLGQRESHRRYLRLRSRSCRQHTRVRNPL